MGKKDKNPSKASHSTTRESFLKASVSAATKPLADQADKHALYQRAVQLPAKEVITLNSIYTALRPGLPAARVLREDFCGTALLCKEWIKRNVEREAIGVDLDESVVKYANEVTRSDATVAERVTVYHGDVMKVEGVPKADIIVVLNYGAFYFHTRPLLLQYFKKSLTSLNPDGVLICDMFGGTTRTSATPSSLHKRILDKDTTYTFTSTAFSMTSGTLKCALNFYFSDGSKLEGAFKYHFRVWSMLELKEAMLEAGFKDVGLWVGRKLKQEKEETDGEEDEDEEEEDDADDGIMEYRKHEWKDPLPAFDDFNAYVVGMA
ncbi:hypothetical protein SAICODRAFT_6190 [Saitoella complicata NRRL Y-17804]|uniref:uncharacterized protein n=1 Tax=Saitoella complicata (strain BCRC 22490 / CBS 7301 / JCM 7358 / NBRC 10748 / NRRL Y-17804) TaxID=698492 RepID=UPI000867E019|nr:uncharacterized protein SAICODRAFT_6190 [Saitoella complicata NRRL Y-17804]ODQ54436.1 hypothetical protein SAICODRAFT_6190 [Saitoella complicata NRRL Y-17804]